MPTWPLVTCGTLSRQMNHLGKQKHLPCQVVTGNSLLCKSLSTMLGPSKCSIPISSYNFIIFFKEWLKYHIYQLLSAPGRNKIKIFPIILGQSFILLHYAKIPKPITTHSIYLKYASNCMFMWFHLNVILVCFWRCYIFQAQRESENLICLIFLDLIHFLWII